MFTRPTTGKLLTTDDLIVFIEELERELGSSAFGDCLTVENAGGAKVAVDIKAVAQALRLRGT